MPSEAHTRADKFLWCVRIFKTRSLSAEACGKGRVSINGIAVKASHNVKEGDVITVRKPPVSYTYKVAGFPSSRTSPKLVSGFITDLTPEEELEKLKVQETFFVKRDRGTGRPTKKDRRTMDNLRSDI